MDRMTREAECIMHPALSAILSIQPSVLDEIMSNTTMTGRGLIARFLYASPPSRIGSRVFRTQPIPPEGIAAYRSLIFRLMALPIGGDVPVVEKQIIWSKRCKDKSLVGTVKETIMQVSSSKKWLSKPALDEQGAPILQKNGKPVLRKSYSVLQDDFFQAMRNAGYTDVERGERGSSEERLTVTQFKVMQEQERLSKLADKVERQEQAILHNDSKLKRQKKRF